MLCLVRALSIYLDKAKNVLSHLASLFISSKRPSRSIFKNAIALVYDCVSEKMRKYVCYCVSELMCIFVSEWISEQESIRANEW